MGVYIIVFRLTTDISIMKSLLSAISLTLLSTASIASQLTSAIEPIMETIPSGTLIMTDRESNQHKVQITEFSLGKYEVTVAEFRRFIEATKYQTPTECRHELDTWFLLASTGNWETNALTSSEYQPVVCINAQAADAYTEWLAKETGKPYRLPTETEWEYAARAGTETDYYFGQDDDDGTICEYENTGDLFGENVLQINHNTSYHNWTDKVAACRDYSAYSSIVGMYKPNPNGLHDMISNVTEFLADCRASDIQQLPTDGSVYLDESCDRRANRGSSWHWSHWPLTSRGSISVDFAGGVDGFRVALDGPKPKQSKATTVFSKDLRFAQQQERKRRESAHPLPSPVANLTLKTVEQGIQLTWQGTGGAGRESYRVYKNDLPGRMFRLHATNLYGTSYIDANPQAHEYEYTVVAVRYNQQSEYSPSVKKVSELFTLPGVIQAEWSTSVEGAGISSTSDKTTGPRVGFNLSGGKGISKGAIIKYQVNITQSGNYQFNYRVASTRDTQGFKLLVDNDEIAISNIANTGGNHEWQTQGGNTLYLPKGEHTLSLLSLDNSWKLNWFELQKI